MKDDKKLKIMVSSSVYDGFHDTLETICSQLGSYGYEVLNSDYHTIKVNPALSNKENCINAVEECDLFFGIIRSYCGSGKIGDELITISEMKKAIELKKPYWFMAHSNVVFARKLLNYTKPKSDELDFKECGNKRHFHKESVEIYNEVIKNEIKKAEERRGNWCGEFYDTAQIMRYVANQFSDINFIKSILKEYFIK